MSRALGTFIIIAMAFVAGCGPSSQNQSGHLEFQGVLSDTNHVPLVDVDVTLFETGESSITDESGHFSIQTSEIFNSAGFFFKFKQFTNTVEIENIPDDAAVVRADFIYNTDSNNVALENVNFGDQGGEPTPTPNPSPGATPEPTFTPAPLYDENGNTTAFGIPPGLSGNITAGKNVFLNICSQCHLESQKVNKSYGQIKAATRNVNAMRALGLSNQQIADVTAYLNRGKK